MKYDDVKYCEICGNELTEFERDNEQDICSDCEINILVNPDIYPNLGDF